MIKFIISFSIEKRKNPKHHKPETSNQRPATRNQRPETRDPRQETRNQMTPSEITKPFKKHLTQLGYRPGTCNMVPECVGDFLHYIGVSSLTDINKTHIEQFYNNLHQRPNRRRDGGLSDTYIHHHVYALKLFFAYLEQSGEITNNPMSVMKFRRPDYNARKPLSQLDIKSLFESCSNAQETAMLHLFYSCGLRRSEGMMLNVKDLHFRSRCLYVREGKGAKRRAVPMTAKVSRDLETYYLHHRISLNPSEEAFMLNSKGNRMSGSSFNKMLKEILSRTTIHEEVSLHHLRHSIATHLLENGLSFEYIRDFLGHSNLESTQIYAQTNNNQILNLNEQQSRT